MPCDTVAINGPTSDVEWRRVDDPALNADKSAVHQFHRHERFPREWRFQQCRLFGGKAEARIVARVSKHDDDPLASCSQQVQSLLD